MKKIKSICSNGSYTAPTQNFTQVSNQILRDSSISLAAKGLYSLILSFMTIPEFVLYKNYMMKQCAEGRTAFGSAWKELQDAGYLSHTQQRQADGTFAYCWSLTCEQQDASTHHSTPSQPADPTIQTNSSPELTSHHSSSPKVESSVDDTSPKVEACNVEASESSLSQIPLSAQHSCWGEKDSYSQLQFLKQELSFESEQISPQAKPIERTQNSVSCPILASSCFVPNDPVAENPAADKGTTTNTEKQENLSKNILSVHSVRDRIDFKKIEHQKKRFSQQIDFSYFDEDPYFDSQDIRTLHVLVELMAEMAVHPTTSIGGSVLSKKTLEGYLSQVDSCLVLEFLEHMRAFAPTNIRHPRAYWKTSLVNFVRDGVLQRAVI